ncbi:hypothetical protein M3Y97_00604900 [Aphelenchoides bicaudatus]|nr:hypothetical protein M3Y97_00604900 [Aphelenchoides bicaudatus]
MATKSALTPATLDEQIQNHIAMAASSQPDSNEPNKNHTASVETDSTQPQTSEVADRKESTLTCQQGQRPSSSDSKQSAQGQSRSNSSRPSKTPSTDALTTFCSENWVQNKYEAIEVELERDTSSGLGITVAGYVHKKGW